MMARERWGILRNEGDGTFTRGVTDNSGKTQYVRFIARSQKDAELLVWALTILETMEHGYMPVIVNKVVAARKPRQKKAPSEGG